MSDRSRLRVNVGNLLELVGASIACFAVAHLAGLFWGLLFAGILVVVAAELIYDSTVLRVPLPRRPRPLRALRRAPVRIVRWRWDRRVRRLVDGMHQ